MKWSFPGCQKMQAKSNFSEKAKIECSFPDSGISYAALWIVVQFQNSLTAFSLEFHQQLLQDILYVLINIYRQHMFHSYANVTTINARNHNSDHIALIRSNHAKSFNFKLPQLLSGRLTFLSLLPVNIIRETFPSFVLSAVYVHPCSGTRQPQHCPLLWRFSVALVILNNATSQNSSKISARQYFVATRRTTFY